MIGKTYSLNIFNNLIKNLMWMLFCIFSGGCGQNFGEVSLNFQNNNPEMNQSVKSCDNTGEWRNLFSKAFLFYGPPQKPCQRFCSPCKKEHAFTGMALSPHTYEEIMEGSILKPLLSSSQKIYLGRLIYDVMSFGETSLTHCWEAKDGLMKGYITITSKSFEGLTPCRQYTHELYILTGDIYERKKIHILLSGKACQEKYGSWNIVRESLISPMV